MLTLDTTPSCAGEMLQIDYSNIAAHNRQRNGYWLVIDRFVYDLSAFLRDHPGGERVLQMYAGRDASAGFARVHKNHRGVARRMRAYRIGVLRESVCDADLEHAQHVAAQRAFREALELLVEMQNALAADHSFQLERVEQTCVSRYELQRKLATHVRFQREYLDVLIGETFARLIASVAPLCSELPPLRAALEALSGAAAVSDVLLRAMEALAHFDDLSSKSLSAMTSHCECRDRALLIALKRQLSRGMRVFERVHAGALPLRTRLRLYAACRGVIVLTSEYFESAASNF